MESSSITSSLVHLFNDIIGAVIPGFVLLTGLRILNKKYSLIEIPYIELDSLLLTFSVITFSFVLGHGLLGFYQFFNGLVKLHDQKEELNNLKEDALYQDLIKCLKERFSEIKWLSSEIDPQKFSPNQIRNISMTISKEGQRVSVRFMFISLLCNGVATALSILLFIFILCHLFTRKADFITVRFVIFSISLIFSIYIFHDRGKEFSRRSFRTPFSTALSDLMLEAKNGKIDSK